MERLDDELMSKIINMDKALLEALASIEGNNGSTNIQCLVCGGMVTVDKFEYRSSSMSDPYQFRAWCGTCDFSAMS